MPVGEAEAYSQKLHRDPGAGFGVGEGVVVPGEIVAAGGGDGLELVVGQAHPEVAAGSRQRVEERIFRIIHAIGPEHGAQASFVEAAVVRDERKPFDEGRDLLPHLREHRCVFGVFRADSMNMLTEPLIVSGFRADEAVEPVCDCAVPDDDDSHAADAGPAFVRRFEVYGCKIFH